MNTFKKKEIELTMRTLINTPLFLFLSSVKLLLIGFRKCVEMHLKHLNTSTIGFSILIAFVLCSCKKEKENIHNDRLLFFRQSKSILSRP